MPKKRDFEKQGCQDGKMKKVEESDSHSLRSLSGKKEDVTPVNNATLCLNTTSHNVAMWKGTMHKELLST